VSDDQVEFLDDVEWLVDDDGTEYFVHLGRRYELGEDGYAYDVGPAPQADATAQLPVAGEGVPEDETAADAEPASRERQPTETIRVTSTRDGNGHQRADAPVAPPQGATLEQRDAHRGNGHGEAMLRIRGLKSGYGSLPVLHGVDFEIERGSTAVLLGLNGAGKTTTATNICGALGVWEGTIELEGSDITSWGVKKCVDAGVVMVPEGRRVFPDLTVDRNLQIGSWRQRKDTEWVGEQRERVLGYFPRLRERLGQNAGTLSGGEQQMLAIARGLMAKPRLLIIDEASMGLAPVIVSQVFEIIEQINEDGVTVLMIEQNVGALDVADVAIVMEQGTIIRELHGDQLQDRALVSETLMG
jgi:branched-chain amino acid transport system ATP-binding protein